MKNSDDEYQPRKSGPARGKKAKKKSHVHIGPNVRAFRVGRAACPVCEDEALKKAKKNRENAEWLTTNKAVR